LVLEETFVGLRVIHMDAFPAECVGRGTEFRFVVEETGWEFTVRLLSPRVQDAKYSKNHPQSKFSLLFGWLEKLKKVNLISSGSTIIRGKDLNLQHLCTIPEVPPPLPLRFLLLLRQKYITPSKRPQPNHLLLRWVSILHACLQLRWSKKNYNHGVIIHIYRQLNTLSDCVCVCNDPVIISLHRNTWHLISMPCH